ncbi:hypothetical protein K431DRAFT_287612 [Polychaeton citri CBS 116435]|uniref:Iron-sulfur assembly protein 1 n=1 Tax=Polychaeton citri CBS 116435 TaxID=1314669 RepID=A0A9P4UMK2_9PEZI|nr:hypothetical protein K431DRAFT_287612 [Polychaeton citri CBS 116435]
MATAKISGPSVTSIFRFASHQSAYTATRSRCAQCLRAQRCPFSSYSPRLQNAKRPLMTETVQRPNTLGADIPPPPKNVATSDTSGSFASQSWLPNAPLQRKISDEVLQEQRQDSSAHGVPSQKTSIPQQKVATPSSGPAKPKRTSKLRPRKAPITLTPVAVSQLRQLFEQPESKMIRVGVKNRGCSGLAYHLEYVDKPNAFDETVEQDGVKVLIDSKALFSIIGSEMDWLEDKLSARFIFKNPNITEQCGCGESFSIS